MRIFVGFVPPAPALDEVDRCVRAARECRGAPRWTPRARWHVTLAFLGEVDDRLPTPLAAALTASTAGMSPPTLRLQGTGVFPGCGAPSVLWAGLAGDLDGLHALAAAVRRGAASAGVPAVDAGFAGHLTLGRWRGHGERADPGLVDLAPGPEFSVDEIRLVRSHLGGDSRHETLARIPLSG